MSQCYRRSLLFCHVISVNRIGALSDFIFRLHFQSSPVTFPSHIIFLKLIHLPHVFDFILLPSSTTACSCLQLHCKIYRLRLQIHECRVPKASPTTHILLYMLWISFTMCSTFSLDARAWEPWDSRKVLFGCSSICNSCSGSSLTRRCRREDMATK